MTTIKHIFTAVFTAWLEVDSITFQKSSAVCQTCLRTQKLQRKRARKEMYCLIHCSDDDGVSPNSVESWRTLRRVEELRYHEDILGIQVSSPDEIPEVYYHRKCRSIFTMKRDLEKIISDKQRRVRKIRRWLLVARATKGIYKRTAEYLEGLWKDLHVLRKERQIPEGIKDQRELNSS